MFDWTNSWVVTGAVAGGIILLGLGGLLLQAGCALADVREPRYLKALGLFAAALAVCAPAGGFLVWHAGSWDSTPSSLMGPFRTVALGVALVGTVAVSALINALTLTTPYRKGLMIAGSELVLAALVLALLSGVVMVVLAVVQIAGQAAPRAATHPPVASVCRVYPR
jgi:hypothetical protein